MTVSNYQYKIDGYKELFSDAQTHAYRIFEYNGYRVSVALGMYTTDSNQAPQEYKEYWYDNPKIILQRLVR